jgi:hypothetical protein
MWARVKGKTENALLALFPRSFMFRPGFIQPVGVKSKASLNRVFYQVTGPLFPLLKRLTPNLVSTNEAIGRAMIAVASGGYPARVLEVRDINRLDAGS